MWCLGTQFSGGLGSVRLTVGLDDLKGLFQHDSEHSHQPVCLHMSNTYSASIVKTMLFLLSMPMRENQVGQEKLGYGSIIANIVSIL